MAAEAAGLSIAALVQKILELSVEGQS
jgi:hypothetical protein